MTREKQLTIALLKEKLQKLTGKKVILREAPTRVNTVDSILNHISKKTIGGVTFDKISEDNYEVIMEADMYDDFEDDESESMEEDFRFITNGLERVNDLNKGILKFKWKGLQSSSSIKLIITVLLDKTR